MQGKKKQAEVVVVGTGAGGGTVARELALRGRDVVMLEKGSWNRWLGNLFSMLRILDRMAIFSRSREGVIIDRAITVGGSTVMYVGNSFDPPGWLKEEYGIDITGLAEEVKSELKVAPFPRTGTAPERSSCARLLRRWASTCSRRRNSSTRPGAMPPATTA